MRDIGKEVVEAILDIGWAQAEMLKHRTIFDKFDGGEPRRAGSADNADTNLGSNPERSKNHPKAASMDTSTPPSPSLSYDPLPDELGRACRKLRILLDPTIFCSDALKQCDAIDREGK